MSSRWWGQHRVRIREPELDPYLDKATCGGAGELLDWFPLRSADLGWVGSPGAIVLRRGRGVSRVYLGVGGLLMLLPSPRSAVVAREWKGMAPPFSSLGLFVVFFEKRLLRRKASSSRPWWRGEDAARRGIGGWDILLGDLGLKVLVGLPHLLPA
jgi:hypothetical protein